MYVFMYFTNQNEKYILKRKKIFLMGWKVSSESDNQNTLHWSWARSAVYVYTYSCIF